MDPAKAQHALSSQGVLFGQHEQLILALMNSLARTKPYVSHLMHQISSLLGKDSSLVRVVFAQEGHTAASPLAKDSYSCNPGQVPRLLAAVPSGVPAASALRH